MRLDDICPDKTKQTLRLEAHLTKSSIQCNTVGLVEVVWSKNKSLTVVKTRQSWLLINDHFSGQ